MVNPKDGSATYLCQKSKSGQPRDVTGACRFRKVEVIPPFPPETLIDAVLTLA